VRKRSFDILEIIFDKNESHSIFGNFYPSHLIEKVPVSKPETEKNQRTDMIGTPSTDLI